MAVVTASKGTKSKRPKSISARTRLAYHEAGHAVLSAAIGNTPDHVSIRAKGHTLGRSGARMSVRPTSRVQVHLAGFAAEHVLTGRRPRHLHEEIGFGLLARLDPELRAAFEHSEDRDGYRAVEEVLNMGVFESDDEIKREVERFYDIVRESLSAAWETVRSVAKALLTHEELDRDAVDEALGVGDLYTLVFAVQRRHGVMPERR